jgi:carbonic anhydrase
MSDNQSRRALGVGLGAIVLALGLGGGAIGKEGHAWKYGPSGSDTAWGGTCVKGASQSPVDLPGSGTGGSPQKLTINYKAMRGATIENNGHTVQVTLPAGNTITVGGKTYALKQFHFHTPSEHLLAGYRFPMEVHLVHFDDEGHPKVVIGIFLRGRFEKLSAEKRANPTAHRLVSRLNVPTHKSKPIPVSGTVNPMDLMPFDTPDVSHRRMERYEYAGSLTTPPCTEGLTWIVMGYRLETTKKVIDGFQKAMGDNHRVTKPLRSAVGCCL